MILLLFVIGYICGSVARQLDELVPVLTHKHRPLFQHKELLFLSFIRPLGMWCSQNQFLNSYQVMVLGVSWAAV
jgi:hypothetical protein